MEREAKPMSKLNVAAVFTVAAAGALFVYTAVVALQAYYQSTVTAEEERKAVAGIDTEVRSLRAAQMTKLSEYKWVDQNKRTVTVPVDLAMELVTRDVTAKEPSLVPALVPAHSVPTVPAVWGRPPDNATPPAPAEPAPAAAEPAPAAAEPAPATAEPPPAPAASPTATPEEATAP